jgi:hypothetical protein
MKARLMIAAALAAMTLHAGVPSPSEENTIIVYFENCIAPKDQFAASTLAAHMLAGAGVRLVWRTDKPSDLGLMWGKHHVNTGKYTAKAWAVPDQAGLRLDGSPTMR